MHVWVIHARFFNAIIIIMAFPNNSVCLGTLQPGTRSFCYWIVVFCTPQTSPSISTLPFAFNLYVDAGDKFDFVNWFYWAVWWQQCCYYTSPYWEGNPPSNASSSGGNFTNNQHQIYNTGNVPSTSGLGIQIRIITGEYILYNELH